MLFALLVTAFVLRAIYPSRMAVEHFDEGVYASNYFSAHLDFRYPDQHLYAPPLFPAILDWTIFLSGGDPHSVMWVNVIFGTGLVFAIWWVTGLIADEAAAIAAAALATFSDFLIQYSRAALTDTPVCFFMVLAVGCGLVALRDRKIWAIIAAGVLTALAWWTKYNGWLPLAILGAGLCGWIVFEKPTLKEIIPRIGIWLVIAGVAFVLWSPCLQHLQQYGGYEAVAKNHAGYVVGLAGWWDSAVRQFLVQSNSMIGTFASFYIAIMMVLILRSFQGVGHENQFSTSFLFFLVLLPFVLLGLKFGALMLFVSFGLCKIFFRSEHSSSVCKNRLGVFLLCAWLFGLLIATPLYRPYPRLGMPFLIAVLIASGIGIQAFMIVLGRWKSFFTPYLVALVGASLFYFITGLTMADLNVGRLLEDRTSLQDISQQIVEDVSSQDRISTNPDLDAVIYVLGEPGLYFHLASEDSSDFEFIANPASNLGMLQPGATPPGIPTYIVAGLHAELEKLKLAELTEQVELIEDYEYEASDLVLLDDYPPDALEENRTQSIQLWKISAD